MSRVLRHPRPQAGIPDSHRNSAFDAGQNKMFCRSGWEVYQRDRVKSKFLLDRRQTLDKEWPAKKRLVAQCWNRVKVQDLECLRRVLKDDRAA